MVFKRSLKTEIKKLVKNICIIVVFFTTVGVFVFNTVFAASNISIPVEIIWDDTGATRPSVILELRKNGSDAIIQTATLDSSNADPNNPNRWFYSFQNVEANAGETFTVTQQSVGGYQITTSSQSTVTNSPSAMDITTPSRVTLPLNTGYHSLGGTYDYVFLIAENGDFYLWTSTNYPSNYSTIVDSLINSLGIDIDPSRVIYLNSDSTTNVRIMHIPILNINVLRLQNGAPTITGVYCGSLSTTSASLASFTNVKIPTRTLTVHHRNADGTEFAQDVVTTYEDGDVYTALPINNSNYEYELQGGAATGTITSDLELTYTYYLINYFAPDISVVIPNKPDYYRVGDIVPFEVTVTNTANYPITDVHIAELMQDATFISSADYTLSSDREAVIASIPANSSIKLYAQYEIIRDLTTSYSNSFEITSASADAHYYLDKTQPYIAEGIFNVRGWQDDPVPSGVNSNGTTFYSFLTLMGALGIGINVVIKYRKKLKERER